MKWLRGQGTFSLCVCAALWCSLGGANEFAGGSGDPNTPYQIATAQQLLTIGDTSLRTKHFILVADLDMRRVWPQTSIPCFLGSLDGQGHTIRNLTIRPGRQNSGLFESLGHCTVSRGRGRGYNSVLPPESSQAIPVVSNLRLEDASISVGAMYKGSGGILAGKNAGVIVNCHVSGTLIAEGEDNDPPTIADVGGLVGQNTGEVLHCSADCSIVGSGPLGGLVGSNLGYIADSQARGYVAGLESVGGLAGFNASYSEGNSPSIIHNCGADVFTTGQSEVGGLVGNNWGVVRFSKALGLVSGERATGGLVGMNGSFQGVQSEVLYSSASGIVIARDPHHVSQMGSLVGMNAGVISDCYSMVAASTLLPFAGLDGGRVQRCFALEERYGFRGHASEQSRHCYTLWGGAEFGQLGWEEIKNPDTFVGWDFWGRAVDGVLDHWLLPEFGLLELRWQTDASDSIPIPALRGASVEMAERRLLATGLHLGKVMEDYCRDKTLALGAIITTRPYGYARQGQAVDVFVNLGRCHWESGTDPLDIQTPGQLDCVGASPSLWNRYLVLSRDIDMTGWAYDKPLFDGMFMGVLDGQGHTVSNLVVDQLFGETVGLFREIGPEGFVGHLNLKQLSLSGGSQVGSIAGMNMGVLDSITVETSVTGVSTLGGLVGTHRGHMINCHITGRINREVSNMDSVGALIGCNDGGTYSLCSAALDLPGAIEDVPLVGVCGSSSSRRGR